VSQPVNVLVRHVRALEQGVAYLNSGDDVTSSNVGFVVVVNA